jgi:signal transduction histidine kinase
MFQSATLKLTLWYASILVAISLLFSVVIYSIASSEVGARIANLQRQAQPIYILNASRYDTMRDLQVKEAEANLIVSLIVTNLCIWTAGSIGSYYLAKRTLRPIKDAHEAQSRFTSDASHELRTPLASMKLELEVALRDPDIKKSEMRELLGSNLEEVNKLTTLSETLLQLSRLDHDKIPREKVQLHAITRQVVERFDKASGRVKLNDTLRVSPIHANKPNLEQLLTILIDNALKYSPENSTVRVQFIQQKGMAGFSVTNSGPGIPADKLPYIFDRFYQGDTSRTGGKRKGFGLGLALAKKLIELHGGELSASSALNAETTFRVLLPKFSITPVNHK